MSVETLAKLTVFYTECIEKGITVHSEEFMNDTKTLIDNEIKILQYDGNFMLKNSGPYTFSIKDVEIYLFPPNLTGEARWAASTLKENERTDYMFQSIHGLVEILMNTEEQINEQSKNVKQKGDEQK